MDTNLYRVSKICWAVESDNKETQVFKDVNDAANYLETLGVLDEEIDVALVDMLSNGATRANFGVSGTFVFSDNARPSELLGTA